MSDADKLERLIEKGRAVLATHKPNPPNVIGFPTLDISAFANWKTQTLAFLESRFSATSPYYLEFSNKVKRPFQSAVQTGLGVLEGLRDDIDDSGCSTGVFETANPIAQIENLCNRFHLIATQLRERHEDRQTLDVQDEYDVQDLFHTLLLLHFEDIRPEEWAPSNAGKSTRMDFLLKQERIVVEIKKTRKGLDSKTVGNELIEDIHRYQSHPDCDALICFVYDPEGRIANPRGLENDLRRRDDKLIVEVFIRQ
ncbi:MAG: hypothetical protein Q8S20_12655 [Sulfuritalea sp.]|nr:hypothetical protein [Sulfuritalea sp.]